MLTNPSGDRPSSSPAFIARLLAAGLLFSTASISHAQPDVSTAPAAEDDDGTIVVTARNRDERLQDVPIPISVLNGDQIATQRVFNISTLLSARPD